jgi:hypothetical protein
MITITDILRLVWPFANDAEPESTATITPFTTKARQINSTASRTRQLATAGSRSRQFSTPSSDARQIN